MTEKEIVRDILKMRGWSQARLAEEVGGWKQTNVAGVLNTNTTGIRTDTLYKMLTAMGCEMIVRDKMGSGKEWKIIMEDK